MQPSVLDPCLFYKLNSNCFSGIQFTQLHDTLVGGTEAFGALEEETSKNVRVQA